MGQWQGWRWSGSRLSFRSGNAQLIDAPADAYLCFVFVAGRQQVFSVPPARSCAKSTTRAMAIAGCWCATRRPSRRSRYAWCLASAALIQQLRWLRQARRWLRLAHVAGPIQDLHVPVIRPGNRQVIVEEHPALVDVRSLEAVAPWDRRWSGSRSVRVCLTLGERMVGRALVAAGPGHATLIAETVAWAMTMNSAGICRNSSPALLTTRLRSTRPAPWTSKKLPLASHAVRSPLHPKKP